MCKFCEITNSSPDLNVFDENEINTLFERIYALLVTPQSLDVNYYQKIARKLTEGVYKGFGKELIKVQWGTPDYDMLFSLRENVYIFSAAKSYQQTKIISQLLTNEKGLRPYSEFKKDAIKEFKVFNENYLKTEYNSAIAQSQSASNWLDIQREKKEYPQLQYETVGDGRVRLEHQALDNITRPVDDKFWDKYYPPNDWNCRCTVLQVVGAVNTPTVNIPKFSPSEVPEIFRFNPGKTKQVFSPKHPYFKVAQQDKELAKQNWGLPLPS